MLVQKGSPISDEKEIYDISEFFVMRKYKRKQIGTKVAIKIWQKFKGRWQVRVLKENKIAHRFWMKTIEKFTSELPVENEMKIKNEIWMVYKFQS